MNRIVFMFLISVIVSSPALAIDLFHKHWKEHYLTDSSNQPLAKFAKRAGCYICHVKGQKKHEGHNEYGKALAQYLDSKDFTKEWVEANPEEAKRRIIKAFQKVEEDLAADGRKYGDKIRAGVLPAADVGL
jgi:hypothetical protein